MTMDFIDDIVTDSALGILELLSNSKTYRILLTGAVAASLAYGAYNYVGSKMSEIASMTLPSIVHTP